MPLFWDIAIGIIIFVCVIRAYHVGFLAAAARLAGVVFAALVAVYAARVGCTLMYDKLVSEPVEAYLVERVEEADSLDALSGDLSEILSDMPLPLMALLGLAETASEEVVAEFRLRMAASINDGIRYIEETIIRPPVEGLFQLVIFSLIFLFLMALVGLLIRALREVRNLPVIGTLNALMGAVLGVMEGLILCILLCFLISLLTSVTMGRLEWINGDIIAKTSVLRLFYQYSDLISL